MPPWQTVCRSVLLVTVVALTSATTAGAHSEYARSEPAAGARIPSAPVRIDIWFTQELFRRIGANTIEVYARDGSRVDDGVYVLDANDRTHLSVGLSAALDPGVVRVEWRSLSALDGDSAQASFEFTIDPSAPEPTPVDAASGETTQIAAQPALSRGGDSLWWLAVAVPTLLASVVLLVRALRAPYGDVRR